MPHQIQASASRPDVLMAVRSEMDRPNTERLEARVKTEDEDTRRVCTILNTYFASAK